MSGNRDPVLVVSREINRMKKAGIDTNELNRSFWGCVRVYDELQKNKNDQISRLEEENEKMRIALEADDSYIHAWEHGSLGDRQRAGKAYEIARQAIGEDGLRKQALEAE